MKRHKRKAANVLLVVFTAILLFSFFQADRPQIEGKEEVTVIHKQEFSGEAPGNVARTYVDQASFDSRIFQDFTFHTILEFHGTLSHVGFAQTTNAFKQFKAPTKVYKQIRKFLI